MTPDLPKVEISIVEMTNAFRRDQKLTELRRNRTLDEAARSFARYLARTGQFSHTADGLRPSKRTERAGYQHCRVAENLALNMDSRGFRTKQLAQGAVEGWKKSPPHRRAMLDPHVIEIGVGVVKAANEHRYLSVQLFGRPRAMQYRFRIRNQSRQNMNYLFGEQRYTLTRRTEVEHTACAPSLLEVQSSLAPRNAQPVPAVFAVSDGDLFVVRGTSRGLRIDRSVDTSQR